MPWILATFVFSAIFNASAHAEVYTWIDSRGIAHFSDYPPGKIPHQEIDIQPTSTVPMSENLRQGKRVSGIRDDVRGLLSTSDRPVRNSGAAAKSRAKLQKICDNYRRKLDRIQSKLRSGYSNDKGNTLRHQRRKISQQHSRECILR
ncbi:DUF4124 domain-containing protein [Marinobacter sp. M216]|uniref:DUF4124 domain-containing protein n=1 Tax=Marinobacter albus TaxID=3030833 RepID=A0ABT7H8G6_9GAMM|nr:MULTISPECIES: DUF4124 domain-containing protein [unclassified Marinobacter]MBW7471058.1 DUF4124 domain-containing protein [Marinobacter sp. F4218]MDK9556651.1 DUF4124 domain-containing protein [Marinobacter sp. M216]